MEKKVFADTHHHALKKVLSEPSLLSEEHYDHLLTDPAIRETIFQQHPSVYRDLRADQQAHPDIIYDALRFNGDLAHLVPWSERKNMALALRAVDAHPASFRTFSHELYEHQDYCQHSIWTNWGLSPLIESAHIDSPLAPFRDSSWYTKFKTAQDWILAQLKDIGIDFPYRIKNFEQAQKILATRATLSTLKYSPRPLALFCYPKFAWITDEQVQPQLSDLLMHGYDVLYYEVSTKEELVSTIQRVGEHKLIDTLLIGGRGARTSIAFSGSGPFSHCLHIRDIPWLCAQELERYLAKKSTVMLVSCETGKIKDNNNTIALKLADVFFYSDLYAPIGLIQGMVIGFDRKNLVNAARYLGSRTFEIRRKHQKGPAIS